MAKKVSSKRKKTSATKRSAARRPSKPAKKTVRKRAKKAVKKAAKKVAKKVVKKGAHPTKRKVKSPLSKAQLKQFREMLLAKRRDLVGDMSGIEAEALRKSRQDTSGDLSSLPTHPADVGTDNFEQEFTLGLLESERELLDEIDEALQRTESGTYGTCLGTGEPIGKARLKARPWAKYCIEYARMIEKGLVRPEEDRENEAAIQNEDNSGQ